MRLVVDASVLVAELLRARGRALVAHPTLQLYLPERTWDEATHELAHRVETLVQRERLSQPAAGDLIGRPDEIPRLRQSELTRTLSELEHVKEAIRQGILTPTTKAMLEEAERRVAECEAAVAAAQKMPAKVEPPSSSIGRYLKDLCGALETDTDRARRLLAKMLGKVTLRREGARLLAEVKGDLLGLLDIDEEIFGRAGAGRGI